MTGCVLRVAGANLAIPAELDASKTRFGFVAEVGDSEAEFKAQIEHAHHFLQTHKAKLVALFNVPGFQSAELDFGVWNKAPDIVAQSHSFPVSLLALAASCNTSLTVTMYLASDDSQPTVQADGPASGGAAP